ncbi:OmpA family protein [Accumulibacter sp.]|uniref:OmpA family protein n=1 Tax=Accumulibacter sp. TaxID=2053492 RepID=UPI00262DEE0D|nr:OmpA family protein [Accumulibacter sp.]HNH92047.1 OmpA family protein [Accumulibacter sp.]
MITIKFRTLASFCALLGLAALASPALAQPPDESVEISAELTPEAIESGLFPSAGNSDDCAEAAKAGFTCGQIVSRRVFSLPVGISFATGSAQLSEAARRLLAQFGPIFKRNEASGNKVVFVGHTDITGSVQLNRRLSQQRAEAVRQYFLRNYALSPSFASAIGVGSEQLKDKSDPASPINRRVEITARPTQ